MDKIIDKLTPYNLFNYLIPGVVFVIFLDRISEYHFIPKDSSLPELFFGIVKFYFIGMIISRMGSLILECILTEKISFVKKFDRGLFAKVTSGEKKDTLVEVLYEVRNTYRTIASMFIILLVIKLICWNYTEKDFSSVKHVTTFILLSILFVYAFRKQDKHLSDRMETMRNQSPPMGISVWPDPANDEVNIQADHPISSLECFDDAGKLMHRARPESKVSRIAIKNWVTGIYQLVVMINGQLILSKFTKQDRRP
jgi:hypothetical protein